MWENAERKENSQVRQNNNRLAIKRSRGSFSSSSRTIDNILSHNLEPFRRYWDPQQVEEVNCMLPTSTASPEPLEPKGWWCWLLIPHHQPIRTSTSRSCTPQVPSLTLSLKTFPESYQGVWTFWTLAAWSPCLASAINTHFSFITTLCQQTKLYWVRARGPKFVLVTESCPTSLSSPQKTWMESYFLYNPCH